MSFMEILCMAWVCDVCSVEVIQDDSDNLPAGWVEHPSGAHACGFCSTARPVLVVVG